MDVLADVELTSAPALDGDPLEEAARQVLAAPTLLEAFSESGLSLLEMLELVESAHWDPAQHPKWPKGTKHVGNVGPGFFMETGQRFRLHGVDYDVAFALPGKIVANVATHGIKTPAKQVEFTAEELKDVERPPAEPFTGSSNAHAAVKNITATVVDPYVHEDTHDPSIPIPATSKITPEEWLRFGRVDQLRYSQVQERFGVYKAADAQDTINAVYKSLDSETKQLLEKAYYDQYYYNNVGFSLSLHGFMKKVQGVLPGTPPAEKARAQYEKVRAAQFNVASAIQWDLYNRTSSPDLTIFKGHSDNAFFSKQVFADGVPIYAGASFSQRFAPGSFGPNKFISKMAIRNIVMSTVSGYATPTHAFQHEQEVAMADPWLPDSAHALNVPDGSGGGSGGTQPPLTQMQSKWLKKATVKGATGRIVDELLKSFADGGTSLPVMPEPPNIEMDNAGGKGWTTPPKDATEFAIVGGKKVAVVDLPYASVTADGKPVARKMKDMVDNGEIHAGDYIEGLKGTRYIVIPDPTAGYLGLVYYKVTDTGQPVPGTEFENTATGQEKSSAFTGHKLWQGGEEAYPFEGDGAKAWKKLAGHYDLTPSSQKTQEKAGFYQAAWAVGGPADEKFVKDFDIGTKFIVAGSPYEVTASLPNGGKKIVNLDNGHTGKINGDTKLPPLVLKTGYTETGEPVLDLADYMQGAKVPLSSVDPATKPLVLYSDGLIYRIDSKTTGAVSATQMSGVEIGTLKSLPPAATVTLLTDKPPGWEQPQTGDTFAYEGGRATITKFLKNGMVQAKKQHGGVVKLEMNDAALAFIHRPDAYELAPAKDKLKNFAAGEKFHGGTGTQQIRPYLVLAQHGKKTEVRNLDTGETVELSAQKSYARLQLKQAAAAAPVFDHAQPQNPTAYVPDAWQPGPAKPIAEYVAGEKFLAQTPHGAIPFEYQGPSEVNEGLGVAVNLIDGKTTTLQMKYAAPITSLVPKTAEPAPTPAPSAVPAGMQPNTEGLALSQLPIGAQVQQAHSMLDPSIEVPAVWELKGFANEQAKLELVKPAVFKAGGDSTGQMEKGHESTFGVDQVFDLVDLSPEQTPPLGTSAPAAVSGPAFDPSAYNEVKNTNDFTVGDLDVGDVFKGSKGGYYQVKSIKEKHVNATSLADGKHTKFATSTKPAALLNPKSASKTPYDELMAGDPTQLGELKQGDQFEHGGILLQVIEPSAGTDEKNASVAMVGPGGHLGPSTSIGFPPNLTVKLQAKKADTLVLPDHQVEAMATDPDSLEDAYESGEFDHGVAYDTPKATQIELMAQGVVFTDSAGHSFKVKQPGSPAIITDGEHLYKLGGYHWAVVEPAGTTFVDYSPDPINTHQDVESELAKQAQQPNDKPFSELDVQPGDTFVVTAGGLTKSFKVTGSNDEFVFAQSELGNSHQFLKGYSPDSYAKKDDVEGLILDDEPAGVPAISVPMEGGAHGPQPAPNVLPLSQLAIGTHFTTENAPGFVYELTAKKQGGKVVQAKVVTAPGMPAVAGTGVSFQGHKVVPTQIGAAGAFDQQTAAPALPDFPSHDIADYGKGVAASAGDFDPGTFVAGLTSAQSPYQVVSSDGLTVTLKQTGGETFDVAATTPMQQLTFGGGGSGGTLKPLHLGAAVITAAGDHGYIKYIETDANGLKKYGVGSTPGSSGAANLAVAYASSLWPASVEDTTAANISSIADMPSPDADALYLGYPPAKPSELVVGDHVIGSNGAELEVTAKGTPTTNSSGFDVYPITLKNVETGVAGGGYYGEDTTVFDVVPPADHTVPGQSVVTGYEEAGPGFKTVSMFNEGDVIVAKGYGGAVLRLGPAKPTSHYGMTQYEVTVIKPGDGVYAKKVGEKTTVYGNALFRPYEGGSMWKVGEYGKVVKPGNVTGKTARVVGHEPDGKLRVRYATGKELVVEASWMHGMNYPTSSTTAKLQFEKVPAGELHPGDIITALHGYWGQTKLVIDSVDEGHVTTHVWGNPDAHNSNASIPSSTPVELIITARQIQGFQGSGTVAPVDTPGAVMPEKPSSAMPPNPPAVGDKVSGVGTGWTAAMYVAHVDAKGLTFAKEPGGDPVTTLNWAQWKQAGGKVIPPTTPPASTLADFEPGGGVMVGDLEVGDQFALTTNDGASVWEITGAPAAGSSFVPIKVISSPQASLVGALTSTTKAYVPGLVKKAKQPGTVKLGTLKKGDQFEVSGYQGTSVYEVVGGGDTSGMVMAQHISGGGSATVSKLPFGTELDVKPVAKASGEKTPFPEGETVASLGLEPGDKVFTDTGSLTIQSIEGEPGTNGYVFNAVDDENGIESTYGMYGHWDGFAKAQQPEQFDPAGWVEGDEVPLETLNVGARFVSHANFDPHYYELVKDEGGVMHFKGLGPMDSDYAATPSTAMVTLIHPKKTQSDAPTIPTSPEDFEPTGEKLSSSEAPVGTFLQGTSDNVLHITGKDSEGNPIYRIVAGEDAGSEETGGKNGPKLVVLKPKGTLAATLKQNLAAVLGGESTTLLALKPGDTFHVGETHGAPEGDYKLLGSALNGAPSGEYVSSVPPKPAEAMWARNLSTGEAVWFGDQLEVTPIEMPVGAAPVEGVDKTPGKPVEQMKNLEVGDHYVTPNGNIYRVDDITGGEMMSVLVKAGGKAWESQVGHGWTFKVNAQTATWKWAAQPAATAAPAAPESSAGLSDILEPYKWHKAGGGKTYPKLGTLAAGTKFADKKHATYTVKGPGAKGYVHYTDEKGQEYAAPAGSHVNVLEGA